MMSRATTRLARRTEVLRIRLLGIAFFLIVALFVWICIAFYNKTFTSVTTVSLVTDTIGNTLPQHADVKVRGLTVGYVKSSDTENGRVTSQLNLDPDKARLIPSNVTARLLPKTLFGERYVSLIVPSHPSAVPLSAGMTVYQDRSGNAIELQKLFDDVLPLLQSIPPQSLANTLGALAQALSGNGATLGVTIDQLEDIFARTNQEMPNLQADIRDLAVFSHTYADAAPQLIDALNDLRTTNATIVARRRDVDALIASLTPTAGRTADFLAANRANIIDVSADSEQALTLLAEYSPSLPCTMANFAYAVPKINTILGQGTDMPGARTSIKFVNPRGRYLPNQDEPRWLDPRGPQCEHVPPNGVDPGQYVGGSANDGSYQPPTRNPGRLVGVDLPPAQFAPVSPEAARASATAPAPAAPTGQPIATTAGSPMEERTLAAIYSAATGIPPQDIPAWTMLIGAPALRGSEVSVK
jgi:virulence factor Mce-like protein